MKNKRINPWKTAVLVAICMVAAFVLLPGISATAATAEISEAGQMPHRDVMILLLSTVAVGGMVLLAAIRINKRKYY